jgi:predicted permease
VLAVLVAIVLSAGAGVLAERRFPTRADRVASRGMWLVLYVALPLVAFFSIARLDVNGRTVGGIGVGYVAVATAGLFAWLVARRLLALPRPEAGESTIGAIVANTGFLGIPVCAALLGHGAVALAVAWDTLISAPTLFLGAFGIGAAVGRGVGESAGERLRSFVVRNPPLLALVLGLVVPESFSPDVLYHAARVLALLILPIGFFTVGVALAEETALPPRLSRPALVSVLGRIVVAPGVVLLASLAVTLPKPYLLQAAMPIGVNSLVVTRAFGLNHRPMAAAIVWSTTLALIGFAVVGPSL